MHLDKTLQLTLKTGVQSTEQLPTLEQTGGLKGHITYRGTQDQEADVSKP